MATIQQFEDIICWQRARELTNQVYKACRTGATSKDRGLCDQIQRASVSVMSNIAEGFERGTKQEFLNYLFIAKGSCGEVRAQLFVMLDAGYLNLETFKYLNGLATECSRLLSSFIQKVKLSAHAGLQYKTEKTERQKAADEVMRQVREINERARQKRQAEEEAKKNI